ncbi:MAG: hypothetical protein QY332_10120 [Anaerolineales bacterium]|nr:MAG: hypothetical protein QY332_10120 [Anaerolineales bacterium]
MTRTNPLDRFVADNSVPVPSPGGGALSLIPSARQVKKDTVREKRREEQREKRRAYDKQNPVETYFIPAYMHEAFFDVKTAIGGLAHQHNATENGVTEKLTEWALRKVRNGELRVGGKPNPSRRKMEVYIEDANNEVWTSERDIPEKPRKVARKKIFAGYRFTKDVISQIDAISKNNHLPAGEVLVVLLQYAIEKYKAQEFNLKTRSLDVRQTVYTEERERDAWA